LKTNLWNSLQDTASQVLQTFESCFRREGVTHRIHSEDGLTFKSNGGLQFSASVHSGVPFESRTKFRLSTQELRNFTSAEGEALLIDLSRKVDCAIITAFQQRIFKIVPEIISYPKPFAFVRLTEGGTGIFNNSGASFQCRLSDFYELVWNFLSAELLKEGEISPQLVLKLKEEIDMIVDSAFQNSLKLAARGEPSAFTIKRLIHVAPSGSGVSALFSDGSLPLGTYLVPAAFVEPVPFSDFLTDMIKLGLDRCDERNYNYAAEILFLNFENEPK